MKTFHNPHHALHQGREEMFRGRMVPCHEVPARLDYVLAELQRRPLGELLTPAIPDAELDAAIARVHDARYTQFLAGAWAEWVAMDPANAQRDALPSVWPLGNRHAFRTDELPRNFAARLGLFSFDSGSPLMAGTWAAAKRVLTSDSAAFTASRAAGRRAARDSSPPSMPTDRPRCTCICCTRRVSACAGTMPCASWRAWPMACSASRTVR